jgi:hypothetical protein
MQAAAFSRLWTPVRVASVIVKASESKEMPIRDQGVTAFGTKGGNKELTTVTI